MVKKAIIAAAGNGTRFLPVTKAYPKELIPILNKPIIHYLVEELIGAGIKEICIIHRRGGSSIRNYFSPDQKLDKLLSENGKKDWLLDLEKVQKSKVSWHFLPQSKHYPYGTGAPILTAQKFIKDDSFVYLYGDDLVLEKEPGSFLASLINIFEKFKASAVFGSQEVAWDEVNRYGSVRFKKDGSIPFQISSVEEALSAGQAPSNFVLFGRFVVSSEVIPVLRKQSVRKAAVSSLKPELLFTDAIKTMAKTGVAIAQPIKKGKWLTTGDPKRWLQANIEYQKFFAATSPSGT